MSHSLFDYIAHNDDAPKVVARQALALANKRVEDRFGNFLSRSASGDTQQRFALIREDFDAVVAAVCEEVGHDDVGTLTRLIWNDRISRISGDNPFAKDDDDEDEDDDKDSKGKKEKGKDDKDDDDKKDKGNPFAEKGSSRTASTREARKPKLCPYHNEVMGISLAQGEAAAGFNAMGQHAWGAKHCKGDEYEGGGCNFKPEMTTQSYWDTKAEKAEERKRVREEQHSEVTEVAPGSLEEPVNNPVAEEQYEITDTGEPETEGGEAEVDAGLPQEELMSVAASTKRFVPLVQLASLDFKDDATKRQFLQTLGKTAASGQATPSMPAGIHMGAMGALQFVGATINGIPSGGELYKWTIEEWLPAARQGDVQPVTVEVANEHPAYLAAAIGIVSNSSACMGKRVPVKEFETLIMGIQSGEIPPPPKQARVAGGFWGHSAKSVVGEALEHQDVTKDTFPKMNPSNERPKDPPDTEMAGSPHPTKREDLQPDITTPRQKVEYGDPEDIGEDVTEHQDVTKGSEFSNKYPNRWASADEAIANFNRS